MSGNSGFNSAMSGLQDVGRVSTYMRTAVTVCFAIILMSVALCLARVASKDVHKATGSAVLTDLTCNNRIVVNRDSKGYQTGTNTYYDCAGDASYAVNGVTYKKNLTFNSLPFPYQNGNSAPVYYDPAVPADVVSAQPLSVWMILAASSASCLIAVLAILWAVLVKHSNVAAGLAGVEGVSDLARGIFRR